MPRIPTCSPESAVTSPSSRPGDGRPPHALATSEMVSGPFAAIYPSPFGDRRAIHLSQAKIIDLRMQSACKDAAEKFAALNELQSGGGHRPRPPRDVEHPRALEAGSLDRERLGGEGIGEQAPPLLSARIRTLNLGAGSRVGPVTSQALA